MCCGTDLQRTRGAQALCLQGLHRNCQTRIVKYQFENACLESRLAEETSAYHRETSISQIDSQEEDGDVTKPMRLRGGQRRF
mgnify:CR=1 FL=1